MAQHSEDSLLAIALQASMSFQAPAHSPDSLLAMRCQNEEYNHAGMTAPLMLSSALSSDQVLLELLRSAPSKQLVSPSHVLNLALPPTPSSGMNPERKKLLKRLDEYCLKEKVVDGDGACQFRSLSDQLYGNPMHYPQVRQEVVKQLREHRDKYSGFVVGSSYEEYLEEMSKPFTWGDHLTLVACSDLFGTTVMVVTSYEDSHVIKIKPEKETSNRVLWLSFYAEVHYNSIYPRDDPPASASSSAHKDQAQSLKGQAPAPAPPPITEHKQRPDSGLKYHAKNMFKLFNLPLGKDHGKD
jgi:hypothetical protein